MAAILSLPTQLSMRTHESVVQSLSGRVSRFVSATWMPVQLQLKTPHQSYSGLCEAWDALQQVRVFPKIRLAPAVVA